MEYEYFKESGIDFGFQKEYLFRIEKSITLEDVNRGVKKIKVQKQQSLYS